MNSTLIAKSLAAATIALASCGVASAAASASSPSTPNDCIRINGGDYNACNVGNSGAGDLPYRTIPR